MIQQVQVPILKHLSQDLSWSSKENNLYKNSSIKKHTLNLSSPIGGLAYGIPLNEWKSTFFNIVVRWMPRICPNFVSTIRYSMASTLHGMYIVWNRNKQMICLNFVLTIIVELRVCTQHWSSGWNVYCYIDHIVSGHIVLIVCQTDVVYFIWLIASKANDPPTKQYKRKMMSFINVILISIKMLKICYTFWYASMWNYSRE